MRWLKFLKKVSCLMAAFRKGHIKVLKWMDGQLVFETSLRHPADREDFEATGNETYVPGKGKKSYNNQYDGDTLNTSSKTSNTSPKQSGKREEGWKEVVRMGQSDDSGRFMNSPFRSKKVSVPTNAISRANSQIKKFTEKIKQFEETDKTAKNFTLLLEQERIQWKSLENKLTKQIEEKKKTM
ncbi:hypothetical protein PUN28_008267 [Cardiocondyla obscurior]|uniref:Uncharacterized protein n=1 Tax=Cardiocondyla obscurior TaxID=286306 RepID=A0AAW2FWU5_9HYME